ncbi:hypothetical protein HZS_5328, partial [Henneguya salminicola]
ISATTPIIQPFAIVTFKNFKRTYAIKVNVRICVNLAYVLIIQKEYFNSKRNYCLCNELHFNKSCNKLTSHQNRNLILKKRLFLIVKINIIICLLTILPIFIIYKKKQLAYLKSLNNRFITL